MKLSKRTFAQLSHSVYKGCKESKKEYDYIKSVIKPFGHKQINHLTTDEFKVYAEFVLKKDPKTYRYQDFAS